MSESIYKTPDGYIAGCLTLRDYFAGKAMQGLIGIVTGRENSSTIQLHTSIVETSYKIADEMLKAREAK